MKANIPTEIRISEIKIRCLEPGNVYTPIEVKCDIMPLGIVPHQKGVTVTMSSELSPHLKEELVKILERDMGIAVKHLQEQAEKDG